MGDSVMPAKKKETEDIAKNATQANKANTKKTTAAAKSAAIKIASSKAVAKKTPDKTETVKKDQVEPKAVVKNIADIPKEKPDSSKTTAAKMTPDKKETVKKDQVEPKTEIKETTKPLKKTAPADKKTSAKITDVAEEKVESKETKKVSKKETTIKTPVITEKAEEKVETKKPTAKKKKEVQENIPTTTETKAEETSSINEVAEKTESKKKSASKKKPVKAEETVTDIKPEIKKEEKVSETAEEDKKQAHKKKPHDIVIPVTPKPPKKIEKKPELKKDMPSYSDEDLTMFKERILVVRKEALEELIMLRERLDDLTNYDYAEESMIYSMHMAEQGSEAMEKEKTYAQIQRINEYIKKLDDALERIKDRTYGVCRVCGCLIAKERLLAVPITTLSASYKIQKKCPEDGLDRIEPLKK